MNKYIVIFISVLFLLVLSHNLQGQSSILSEKDSIKLDKMWNIALKRLSTLNHTDALPILLSIDSFAFKIKNTKERLYALNFISYSFFKLEDYEGALINLDKTNLIIEGLNILPNSVHYANLFYLYGLIYKRIGKYEAAIYFFDKAIDINIFSFRKDDVYENMAFVLSEYGDYKKSENYFKQAIKEIDSLNFNILIRDRATRYNNMAKNYEKWNKLKLAFEYYQRAVEKIPPNTKDSSELTLLFKSYCNFVRLLANQEDFEHAYAYLKQAQKISLNNDKTRDLNKITGILKKQENNYEEAIAYFRDALTISKNIEGNKHPKNSEIYNYLGETYALKNKHYEALNYYQESLINLAWDFNDSIVTTNPSLVNINDPPQLFKTLHLKATSLAEIGNLPKALETYQLAARLIDIQCNHYLATEESRLFWTAKAKPLYEKAIEIALKLDQKEVVFDFIQRGHGLLLLQNMQQAEGIFSASLPDSLKKQDLFFKMSKSALDSRLLLAQKKDNQEKIQQLETQQLVLGRKNEQFHKYLKEQYPLYAQAVSTFSHKSIATIRQEVITNKNALIEYFIGEETIYSMVITQNDLQIFKTHKSENFNNQINALRQLIQQYDYSLQTYIQFCKTGFDLYETLLKQALTELPSTINQLIIIPDEQLNYIPFAAILDTPVNVSEQRINYFELPYLINKYAISYNYSSSLFGKLLNEGNTNEVVGFAPSFGGAYSTNRNLDSLIYNTAEIQIIDSIVGCQMYLREEATLAAFKENITHSNILHLATHASVNDSLPMDSYIYFSKDSLPIHEIPTLRQSLNLAVLSACETGKGMLRKGEGIISLARAFIQSGCPSVVTSLWKVNDPKTPALMKHFYLELKSGKSKNIALSIAQKKYMREEAGSDAYAHPYYWATFIQIGDTNPLFVDKKYLALLFTATLIGAFLLFVAWKFIFKQKN